MGKFTLTYENIVNIKWCLNWKIHIGKDVRVLSNAKIKANEIHIEDGVVSSSNSYITDEGYPVTYAPVTINDGAWVSTSIIVLPGVTIGKNVIVGQAQ